MIFEVNISKQDKIRNVYVPDEVLVNTSIEAKLDLIFHYGQNCIQPVPDRCSVSIGDVIIVDGRHFMVNGAGFIEEGEEAEPWLSVGFDVREGFMNALFMERFGYLFSN